MTFIVLEGFSGTGKSTLAWRLQCEGWLRIKESAHSVPANVPVADRGNAYSDYALFGSTLRDCFTIASYRDSENIVAEGYLLSDLTYSQIRYKLGKSDAYPILRKLVSALLGEKPLQPDLYILLWAPPETIARRQSMKGERERINDPDFMLEYYKMIHSLHASLGQTPSITVRSDRSIGQVLDYILDLSRKACPNQDVTSSVRKGLSN